MFTFALQQRKQLLQVTTLLGKTQAASLSVYQKNQQKDWAFPKHKQLLTEDFYDEDPNHQESNPYSDKGRVQGDIEDFN